MPISRGDYAHDWDDPLDQAARVDAAVRTVLAARHPCRHCAATYEPLPMAGTAWGIAEHHEPGCPMHEDFHEPAAISWDDAVRRGLVKGEGA